MACRTPGSQFIDESVVSASEVGLVVVLEEFGAPAVDTAAVPFEHDSFLSTGRVPLASRRVDGIRIGVVYQCPSARRSRLVATTRPRARHDYPQWCY